MKKFITLLFVLLRISLPLFFGFVVLIAGMLIFVEDEPLPYDRDLQVNFINLKEKENSLYHFNMAAAVLYWPDNKNKEINDMIDGVKWDSDFIRNLLEKNEDTLNSYNKGLHCRHSQVLETKKPFNLLNYQRPAFMITWRKIALLSSLRAMSLFKSGKEKEAFDAALDIVKYGHIIENSKGDLIYYMIGIAIKEKGIKAMGAMVKHTSLRSGTLKRHITQISKYNSPVSAFSNTFKVEYNTMAFNLSQDFEKAVSELPNASPKSKVRALYEKCADRVYSRLFFQRNKTRRMYAEFARKIIADASKPCSEISYEPPVTDFSINGTVKQFLSGNSAGEILVAIGAPNFYSIHKRRCSESFNISGTQLLLALKCYKIKTGNLPDTIDELVPTCIHQIPPDPFDGKPLRYSKAKKLIWSVGTDLKDSGGREHGEAWEMNEPSIKIEF